MYFSAVLIVAMADNAMMIVSGRTHHPCHDHSHAEALNPNPKPQAAHPYEVSWVAVKELKLSYHNGYI